MLPQAPDDSTNLSDVAPSAVEDPPIDLSIDRLDAQETLRVKGRLIGELSDAELAAAERGLVASPPPDERAVGNPRNWSKLRVQWPQRRVHVHLRVDEVVLDWFQRDGPGFQARTNAVLRAYVDAQLEAEQRRK
jgi:uncharacterized protein (DUF4415 family)